MTVIIPFINFMHYNQFTIDYIVAIQRNLCIEVNSKGEAVFFPEKIKNSNIESLKKKLSIIFNNSQKSIEILEKKKESIIQAGLFGLVDDLDKAIKVGFLIADRVVLIDYLFERLLQKPPEKIDRVRLGVITSSLVAALPLAETGRVVIIPNPFHWHPESKKIIAEVSTTTTLTVDLMSLLNMLSITKKCKLHPFTIAESESVFSSLINDQIDHVDVIGRDGGKYAYDGILGALLSEKFLKETELKVALDVPLSRYFEIVSSEKDFYLKYLSAITTGGSLSAQNNINKIRDAVLKSIEERNKKYLKNSAKALTIAGGVGSGTIGVLAATSLISAPLAIAGAIMALSATLTGLVNSNEAEEQPVISVFNKLYNA